MTRKNQIDFGTPTESFLLPARTKNLLIKHGYLTAADFQGKTKEDIQEIKGISKAGALEVFEYLNLKFGIKIKKRPPDPKTQQEKELYNQARQVVDHFLKHNKFIKWANEIATAKNLLKIYPFETLMKAETFPWLKTLIFFFTENGKKHLSKYLATVRLIEEKPKTPAEPDIFSEDFYCDYFQEPRPAESDKKPKTLKDWLKK